MLLGGSQAPTAQPRCRYLAQACVLLHRLL